MPEDTLDDEYQQYLWGESSPRSFARKAKVAGKKFVVVVDEAVDIRQVVSR